MPLDPRPTVQPRAASVPNTAIQTGFSTRSIWRLIALRELDVVRCGRAVRVTQASIDRFIARGGARW